MVQVGDHVQIGNRYAKLYHYGHRVSQIGKVVKITRRAKPFDPIGGDYLVEVKFRDGSVYVLMDDAIPLENLTNRALLYRLRTDT